MQPSSFSELTDAVRAAHHPIGNSLQSVASLLSLQGREAEPRTANALFEASRLVRQMHGSHPSATGPFGTLVTIRVAGPTPEDVTS